MQERWRALNEIDGGDMENMTYEEIADKFPEEYEDRKQNKFTYRYPNGESYQVIHDCIPWWGQNRIAGSGNVC